MRKKILESQEVQEFADKKIMTGHSEPILRAQEESASMERALIHIYTSYAIKWTNTQLISVNVPMDGLIQQQARHELVGFPDVTSNKFI